MIAPRLRARPAAQRVGSGIDRRQGYVPAVMHGCPGKFETSLLRASLAPNDPAFYPLPPLAGGRGQGEGGRPSGLRRRHLTLPDAVAPGSLPLPPVGRRGAVFSNGGPTDDALWIEDGGNSTTGVDSPDSPARKRERTACP